MLTGHRDSTYMDRGGRRTHIEYLLVFVTHTGWMVMPLTETRNTGREPGHFRGGQGKDGREL